VSHLDRAQSIYNAARHPTFRRQTGNTAESTQGGEGNGCQPYAAGRTGAVDAPVDQAVDPSWAFLDSAVRLPRRRPPREALL